MKETAEYAFDIDVDSRFLDEESAPDEGRFVFAYTIHIRNRGQIAALAQGRGITAHVGTGTGDFLEEILR